MKRRKFIKRSFTGLLTAGMFSGLYAWQIEPFWLEFVSKKMSLKNLPKHNIGKTIMQISDIHVGNKFDFSFIIDSFKKAQKFNPDFVVYTGDYITYENKLQFDQLELVAKNLVKGKYATLGVLGNHDYGFNWSNQKVANRVTGILENAGVQILSNQSINIEGLHFIGLDDYWGLNFNPMPILKSVNNEKSNIVLCHNPDVCDLPIWEHYEGWILSGHTHGGQCKPPFLNPPMLPVKNKKYSQGEIDLATGRTLYINRALGHLRQIRFNVRPEITVFELEQKT